MRAVNRKSGKSRKNKRGGANVGLFGGSFHPFHAGHQRVAQQALRRLGLNQVLLLPAASNPLKLADDLPSIQQRADSIAKQLNDSRIRVPNRLMVKDLEASPYLYETLKRILRRHKNTRFVWIMGADLLTTFHLWHRYKDILTYLPIAVFARPHYDLSALSGKTATRFRRSRLATHGSARSRIRLPYHKNPAWVFVVFPRTNLSSTFLRQATL